MSHSKRTVIKKIAKNLCFLLCLFETSAYSQTVNTISQTDKIYGLSTFWKEARVNFVYLNKFGAAKWDATYQSFIPRILATTSDYNYYRELQQFCALLKDGHTNVYLPERFNEMTSQFGSYRFFVENIENKAVITCINASKVMEIPIGSEIIEVNGLSTNDYIDKYVSPFMSSSTDYSLRNMCVYRLLSGLPGSTYHIKIRRIDRKIISLTLTHSKTIEKEFIPKTFLDFQEFNFKWLKNGVAYIAINSFEHRSIDSLFTAVLPELRKARGLIVDLRLNGGGNSNFATDILEYLTNDSVLHGAISLARENNSTLRAWGASITPSDTSNGNPAWGLSKSILRKAYLMARDSFLVPVDYNTDTVRLKAKRLIIPTVILMGNQTASAAEDFLIYADNQRHMTRIGDRSFGSTGQPISFDLPGGGSGRVCAKMDTYPNGKLFVGVGVLPQIYVRNTLKDLLAGKDAVLDFATEFITKELNHKK